jgi:hypothetical protein
MAKTDKVLVTNGKALRAKYGDAFDVGAALRPLLDADAARGLESRVIDLAASKDMKTVKGTAVSDAADPGQNKRAVDKVFTALRPDYLVIVGSVDVVPHQDLANTMPDDGDPIAWGDLPYACEAAYGTEAGKFRAPTRVVGRLADQTGATKPAHLKKVIATAAKAQSRKRSAYESHLSISAEVWKKSTQLSLRNTFGSPSGLKVSPSDGPKWTKAMAGRRTHFINCHGAAVDPLFYGQRGASYPTAHDSAWLEGRIAEGTVAAVECCYGAELYDPTAASGPSIVSAYTGQGAYGFLGSSTIAYGPAEGNGSADLLCQFFIQRVLAGASLGRAALEARQRFVRETNVLDPADLKTLAQFSLIGDPSIVPVLGPLAPPAKAKTKAQAAARTGARQARRSNLLAMGMALEASRSYASPQPKAKPARLTALKRDRGLKRAKVSTFKVERPSALAQMKGPLPDAPDTIHVLLEPIKSKLPADEFRLVIAAERKGDIVSVKDLYSR